MNKKVVIFSFVFLSACANNVPKSLTDNPNVVITNEGLNNYPAFKSITFNHPDKKDKYAEKCLLKETGSAAVSIGDVYSTTAQGAYRSVSLRRSIPFQYNLSIIPGNGIYRFEQIRFNEGQLGGPLYASTSFNSEQAYNEMEAISKRVYDCL